MRAVHHPRAAVGMDGANFIAFLKRVRDELRHPWRFMTVDLTKAPISNAGFDAIVSRAASGVNGARRAQNEAYNATLRGLEEATGKHLPKGCFR